MSRCAAIRGHSSIEGLTLCANRSCCRFRPDLNLERELEETAEAREAEVIARCIVVWWSTKLRKEDCAFVNDGRVEEEQTEDRGLLGESSKQNF